MNSIESLDVVEAHIEMVKYAVDILISNLGDNMDPDVDESLRETIRDVLEVYVAEAVNTEWYNKTVEDVDDLSLNKVTIEEVENVVGDFIRRFDYDLWDDGVLSYYDEDGVMYTGVSYEYEENNNDLEEWYEDGHEVVYGRD